jgi:NAD+ diphosphatase
MLTPHSPPNLYAAGPLDRADGLRSEPAWLDRALADPDARLVPVWRSRNLVLGEPGAPEPVFLPGDHPAKALARTVIFLGLQGQVPVFALELKPQDDPPLGAYGAFQDLRSFGPLIDRDTAAILATARGLSHWHDRNRFCSNCGGASVPSHGGWRRDCTDPQCGAQHFPRIDPAVIVLVHDGADRVILGRQAIWPPGMHSVLAGFVEPGESLEDCVAREMMAEVGVPVRDIAYRSSQPWPFPQSLMLGFRARADADALTVNEDELESARWFTRQELLASPENENFRLPRRDSIARRLLAEWLDEGD